MVYASATLPRSLWYTTLCQFCGEIVIVFEVGACVHRDPVLILNAYSWRSNIALLSCLLSNGAILVGVLSSCYTNHVQHVYFHYITLY